MDASFAGVLLVCWLAIGTAVSLLWGLIARTMERDRDTDERLAERGAHAAAGGRRRALPERRRSPHTRTA
jgi:hypothetical protein